MNTYLIRKIEKDDLGDLMSLIEEHTAYEQAAYNSTGKQERLGEVLFKENSPLNCWVVEVDNEINGFCSFTFDYSTWDAASFLYMDCLYLREKCRGLGIGSALIKKLEVVAKEKGCVNLQWHTPIFNTPAIAFYKKTGATGKDKVRFTLDVDF